MSGQFRWVDKQALLLLHSESLAEHGGLVGTRDEGLLDSALARPLNLAAYGAPDLADLAAIYGVGLAKNPPFLDGNKRAAFLAVGLFLYVNGFGLKVDQASATHAMLAVAAGELDETEFAAWLRANIAARR